MSADDAQWLVWAGVTLGSFGVMEGLALKSGKSHATLSATLRRWLGIEPRRRWRYVGIGVFAGFMVWFAGHILFGIWGL